MATAAGLGATLNSLSVTALACAGAAAAGAGAVAAAGAATVTVFDGVPSSFTATATRLASAMMSAPAAKNAKRAVDATGLGALGAHLVADLGQGQRVATWPARRARRAPPCS